MCSAQPWRRANSMLCSTGTTSSFQPCTMVVGQSSSFSRSGGRPGMVRAGAMRNTPRACTSDAAAAETGAAEHEVALELLAELHELVDALAWIVDAAVVHGFDFVSFAARIAGQ